MHIQHLEFVRDILHNFAEQKDAAVPVSPPPAPIIFERLTVCLLDFGRVLFQ